MAARHVSLQCGKKKSRNSGELQRVPSPRASHTSPSMTRRSSYCTRTAWAVPLTNLGKGSSRLSLLGAAGTGKGLDDQSPIKNSAAQHPLVLSVSRRSSPSHRPAGVRPRQQPPIRQRSLFLPCFVPPLAASFASQICLSGSW